jgi:Fe-S cluster assembly protein SufD
MHPSDELSDVPEAESVVMELQSLDGSTEPAGVTLDVATEEDVKRLCMNGKEDVSTQFIQAMAEGNVAVLRVARKAKPSQPVLLNIECNGGLKALHLLIDVGELAELELVTRISGDAEWVGILRQGIFGNACNINDIVINHMGEGRMLRTDGIHLGRDAQVRGGTVGSGSSRCKADLRYTLDEVGASLKINGSILSLDGMHNDHHVEILHLAPQTYSRLDWHSACAGKSRTIGTGMLRIEAGAKGADAGQLFHNLLLSKDAEADSIPELEVSENDVVGCGHGTANGPVDDDQMFYLKTRGFNDGEARDVLVAAFLNATLTDMGSEAVHEHLLNTLTRDLAVDL